MCLISKKIFINDISSAKIHFLINTLEARRSLEYLNYIKETRMIPPLLTTLRLHSLLNERRKYPIMYNEFFIQQAIKDLIIIYQNLGATVLVKKLQQELIECNRNIREYKKHMKI